MNINQLENSPIGKVTHQGKWKEAYEILTGTNDFPEFTGRICPALCEKSCVLKLSMDAPVTIREDEAIIGTEKRGRYHATW
jgi:NADPH-dependent glutamate synthase beta subunit-like oxidoreductase